MMMRTGGFRPGRALLSIGLSLALAACGSIVEQSPTPSRSPVQASPNPNLVEFESHLVAAKTAEGAIVRAIAKASAGSRAELLFAAHQLRDWAAGEESWLDDHPADACYAAAADTYRTGVEAIATSATGFESVATASGAPNDAEGQAAGQGLSTGTDAIDRAGDLARASRAACR